MEFPAGAVQAAVCRAGAAHSTSRRRRAAGARWGRTPATWTLWA